MSDAEPLIRNVSDTALWAAVYRAAEAERPDALFRDPYARRLAGDRGRRIADSVPGPARADWAWMARTLLCDRLIVEQLGQGVDQVVNLAAGLDARPYRMALPPSLHWVEVDLPGILDYKEEVLAGEKPACSLERVRLDLSDGDARRALFARLDGRAGKTLVLSEGLLIYLDATEVASLARDLAAPRRFAHWIVDIASPGLLRMLQRSIGSQLDRASAPLRFGPPEGPGFFTAHGWRPVEVLSLIKAAARHGRLTLGLRLVAMLPESRGRQGSRPWSAVCLLARDR